MLLLSYFRDLLKEKPFNGGVMPALDGVRGVAALLVFFVHFTTVFHPWVIEDAVLKFSLDVLRDTGRFGVDIFFVLSGFLIYGGMIGKNSLDVKKYVFARCARVLPLYWVCLILTISIYIVIGKDVFILGGLLDTAMSISYNFFLVPSLLGQDPIVTVSWTLTYEMIFYLAVPLLLFGVKFSKFKKNLRVVLLLATIVFTFLYFLSTSGKGPERILFFLVGVTLFEVKDFVLKINNVVAFIATIIIVVAGAITLQFNINMMLGISLNIIACFLVGIVWFKKRNFGLIDSRLLRVLGDMSYSFYLFHSISLHAFIMLLGKLVPASHQYGILGTILLCTVAFFVSIVFCFFVYAMVEKPIIRITKKLS